MNDEVRNQPPPLVNYNLFTSDRALREAVAREGGGWACAKLEEFGQRLGTAEVVEWAAQANENPPVLHTHDRRLEHYVSSIESDLTEPSGRRLVQRLALALQASLMLRFSPTAAANAFCASRLEGDAGYTFGTLPPGIDAGSVLAAATTEA